MKKTARKEQKIGATPCLMRNYGMSYVERCHQSQSSLAASDIKILRFS